MKPVIGIPGNTLTSHNPDYTSVPLAYTPQGFVEGLTKAGALPVVFPISTKENAKQYVRSVDAILLAGGQDVSPLLYGEEPHLKLQGTSPLRDYFELAVIEEAWKQNKPILAICRGMQLLTVAFGGSLYQDVSLYPDLSVQHLQLSSPETAIHSVKIKETSWMGTLFGDSLDVNSYHHQAIKELPDTFTATAWSQDGLVEAFEATDKAHLVIGVQWHPELMINHDEKAQALFDSYVMTVKEWNKVADKE